MTWVPIGRSGFAGCSGNRPGKTRHVGRLSGAAPESKRSRVKFAVRSLAPGRSPPLGRVGPKEWMLVTTAAAIPGLDAAPTKHKKLLAWVREVAELTQPERVEWCDGSQEEWDRLTTLLVDAGTFVKLDEKQAAQQLLCRVRPQGRRPGREPHLHLFRARRGCRPDQQLGRAGRDARHAARACSPAACAAGRCTSFRSAWARWVQDLRPRRRDHRLRRTSQSPCA